jgi:alkanesulfonate monooxygenase SsuD/methylene tetrahydromethanopterin reductase-like flavin-dependent oxidoreductase (luciferase family)
MKVGVLQFFSWPERRVPLATVYNRALERIEVMDQTGYDAVWLAEHHFGTYSVCPSVHLMAMHVADRTNRLRIGTAVTLAAFYHPLRIAEEVALLDVLSGGRVNWGVGRGFDKTEYQAFDVAPDDSYPRFREHVDVVLQAWTNDRLTYRGQFWQFDDVEVLPKPHQAPCPPTWIASTSPGAIEWSAREGFSILMDPHSSHVEIGEKRRLYDDTLAAAGHTVSGRDIPVARLLAVAPTMKEAEEIARRGAKWITGAYANPDHQIGGAAGVPGGTVADPVNRYVEQVVLWGTPDKIVDQLQELRETISLEYLMCAPLSHSTFELFTEKVLPKLA